MRPWMLLLALLLTTFVMWGLWGVWIAPALVSIISADDLPKLGLLGDLFGGVNALFTALAFALLWWTSMLQKEELSLQRRELTETKGVFEQQTFEATYFNLLSFLRQLADDITFTPVNGDFAKGTTALRILSKRSEDILGGMLTEDDENIKDVMKYKHYVNEKYKKEVYNESESSLGPYFRTMYHLFRMIDDAEFISEEKKRRYANMARAQLGSEELILLTINGVCVLGEKFKPLIERYGLLKHVPRKYWFTIVSRTYSSRAFLGADEAR